MTTRMRSAIGAAAVIAVCCTAGCTGSSSPVTKPGNAVPTASSPRDLPSGTTVLDCSDPIGTVASPTGSLRNMLDVVGLDMDSTSTLKVTPRGGLADPHPLSTKVGLLVHAGREATVTVPGDWASKVSITWGNHPTVWTTSLYVPACPLPWPGADQWLLYPGLFSLDAAACVPLEVRAGTTTTTVSIPVGVRCPA